MKNKLYFGYTTQSHGLKGELKCFTDFERKDIVLQENMPVYINDQKHFLTSIRPHKDFYLIRFDQLTDINDIEAFRHQKIYVAREDLKLKEGEFLFQDLIGFSVVFHEEIVGKVVMVRYNKSGKLLEVHQKKNFFIPYNEYFIKKIDWATKQILAQNLEGLML